MERRRHRCSCPLWTAVFVLGLGTNLLADINLQGGSGKTDPSIPLDGSSSHSNSQGITDFEQADRRSSNGGGGSPATEEKVDYVPTRSPPMEELPLSQPPLSSEEHVSLGTTGGGGGGGEGEERPDDVDSDGIVTIEDTAVYNTHSPLEKEDEFAHNSPNFDSGTDKTMIGGQEESREQEVITQSVDQVTESLNNKAEIVGKEVLVGESTVSRDSKMQVGEEECLDVEGVVDMPTEGENTVEVAKDDGEMSVSSSEERFHSNKLDPENLAAKLESDDGLGSINSGSNKHGTLKEDPELGPGENGVDSDDRCVLSDPEQDVPCVHNKSLNASGQDSRPGKAEDEAGEGEEEGHGGGGGGKLGEEMQKDDEDDDDQVMTFEEFKKKLLEEGGGQMGQRQPPDEASLSAPSMNPILTNYASFDCGAKVVKTNPEAKNAMAILHENRDMYMINPCAANIFFVVELCEVISVRTLEIACFELFSSIPKIFKVYTSESLSDGEWVYRKEFEAQNERVIHSFPFAPDESVYAKFIKVEMVSHYGQEHFCPLSLLRVLGASMMEVYEESRHVNTGTTPPPVTLPPSALPSSEGFGEDDQVLRDEEAYPINDNGRLLGVATDVVMSVLKRPLSLLGKMNDLMKPEGDRAATDTLPSQPSHADHMAGIIDDKRPSESEEVEGGKDGSDTEEIPMKEAEVIPDVRNNEGAHLLEDNEYSMNRNKEESGLDLVGAEDSSDGTRGSREASLNHESAEKDGVVSSLTEASIFVEDKSSNLPSTTISYVPKQSSYSILSTPVRESDDNLALELVTSEKSDSLGPDLVPNEAEIIHTGTARAVVSNDCEKSPLEDESGKEIGEGKGGINCNGSRVLDAEKGSGGDGDIQPSMSDSSSGALSLHDSILLVMPSSSLVVNNEMLSNVMDSGDILSTVAISDGSKSSMAVTANLHMVVDTQSTVHSTTGDSQHLHTLDMVEMGIKPHPSFNERAHESWQEMSNSHENESEMSNGNMTPSFSQSQSQSLGNGSLSAQNGNDSEESHADGSSSNSSSDPSEVGLESNSSLIIGNESTVKFGSNFSDLNHHGNGSLLNLTELVVEKGDQTANTSNSRSSTDKNENVTSPQSGSPVAKDDAQNHNENLTSNGLHSGSRLKGLSPLPSQQKERSVFLRLSNHIEDLETNMTVFSIFLDQISSSLRKNRNKTEETSKWLERRITSLNDSITSIRDDVELRCQNTSELRQDLVLLLQVFNHTFQEFAQLRAEFVVLAEVVIILLISLTLVLLFSLLWQCHNQRCLKREMCLLIRTVSATSRPRMISPPVGHVDKVESIGAYLHSKALGVVESRSDSCVSSKSSVNHVKFIRSSSMSKLSDLAKVEWYVDWDGGGVFAEKGQDDFGGSAVEKLPSTQSSSSSQVGDCIVAIGSNRRKKKSKASRKSFS